jgi:hypothetical protein
LNPVHWRLLFASHRILGFSQWKDCDCDM